MIRIKSEIRHGGPEDENGGKWPVGDYTVGDRPDKDYARPGKLISQPLAQYFVMHGWAEATEGEAPIPGRRAKPGPAVVQPDSVTQRQAVSQPRRR